MTGSASLTKRLAFTLMLLGLRLLPPSCNKWAKAMLAEFYYLEHDYDALVWATGCLIAGITVRIEAMTVNNLKISRWILAPELIFCFAPLTWAWFDSIFGMSGIIRLNSEIIQNYFINSTTGTIVLVMMISLTVLGILGPAGLFAAFRLIALRRPLINKWAGVILMTGPVVLGVIYITGWLLTGTELQSDRWGGILMFSVLPAIGAAHVYFCYSRNGQENITA